MCGIIGMIHYRDNGFDNEARNAIVPAMLLNSMRGAHSTGVIGVRVENKKDKMDYVKRVGPPYALFMEEQGKEFLSRMFSTYHAVIGHGRYATTGNVVAKNAHPFVHDHIALVHNGSVRNLWNKEYKGEKVEKKFEVDSEVLTWLFAQQGAKKTLTELYGAFALLWYDRKTRHIHAFRNDERPLFLMERTDIPGTYFSSEPETLRYIADRFKMKAGDPQYLIPDTIYSFPVGTGEKNMKYTREKIERKSLYQAANDWIGNRAKRYPDYENYDWGGLSRDTESEFGRSAVNEGETVGTMKELFPAARLVNLTKTESKAGQITDISKFGIKLTKGDLISFFPNKHENLDNKTDVWYVSGTHVASPKIHIACHFNGAKSFFMNQVVMVGKISHMLYLSEDHSEYSIRVYIEELQQIPDAIQERLMNKEIFDLQAALAAAKLSPGEKAGALEIITLKNGDTLTFWRYEMMLEKKCAHPECKGNIQIQEAANCLPVSANPNASDAEKLHGGLYCPDCVTHRLSH